LYKSAAVTNAEKVAARRVFYGGAQAILDILLAGLAGLAGGRGHRARGRSGGGVKRRAQALRYGYGGRTGMSGVALPSQLSRHQARHRERRL
jgi:hypothetical protein